MRYAHWLLLPLGMAACGDPGFEDLQGSARLALDQPDFGEPLAGLTDEQRDAFDEGLEEFSQVEGPADGLGPVFNGRSCAECHAQPALGGSSAVLETRFGALSGGRFDALLSLGGSLIQTFGLETVSPTCAVRRISGETVPASATLVAKRRSTALFGLGLVDNVPDATLRALASAQAGDPDGVSGRVHLVLDVATGQMRVGKLGWKAQVATVAQFAADAYLNELGVTSPLFPDELCPQGNCALRLCDLVRDPDDDGEDVNAFASFMSLLAPPPSARPTGQEQAGENSFHQIGCATCHVAELKTGASTVAALNQVTFHPYSDFLLHDMGALGDGIAQGDAAQREMRTSPLWGVSHQPSLLHDGRTTTLEGAILAHDGEAKKARDRFAQLASHQREKIVAFLQTL